MNYMEFVNLAWLGYALFTFWQIPFLNHYGCIPRGLPRVPSFRRTPESRNRTGCRIKSGMTQNTPLLAAG